MAGPFDVEAAAIARLEGAFAPFINDLVEAERAVAGVVGSALEINSQVNTADGGVDAALRRSTESSFLPSGDSAWQFKSSDLAPAECKNELLGATWALELMADGATYVLVLGSPLVDAKIGRRLKALREAAADAGIAEEVVAAIRLYDGNKLSRWVSTIPALALDRRLGAPGPVVQDHTRWSESRDHQEKWVACDSRIDALNVIQRVTTGDVQACRVEGPAGLGKTRLVMEALRETEARRLVAYAPVGDQVSTELLTYLGQPDRTCVLVADNCSQAQHKVISEQLSSRSGVSLVTVGHEGGDPVVRDPVYRLKPALDDELEAIVQENIPALWQEARRVVKAASYGNIRTALLLGERLLERGETGLAELLRDHDLRGLVLEVLPEHAEFFHAAVLALFERIGWDRDRRYQLDALAEFAGISSNELEQTARALEGAGLLTQAGRYRAVGPEPVAVFLAAHAWERLRQRILEQLVPLCDREMIEGLFRRCASLGRFEPAAATLADLLGPGGSLASLERIESGDLGELIVQLAIVLPDRTSAHLAELIEATDEEALSSYTQSRRALVRALEKLVWHEQTFVQSADGLLRLALAENETWANNSTGTWKSLFGARLPATAASPATRLEYLRQRARDDDSRVRLLATEAISGALHPHESVTVSGELQGGAVVAPRGSVQGPDEALSYWETLVRILDQLQRDEATEVGSAARDALIAAIHPLVDAPRVGDALVEALLDHDAGDIASLRATVDHLIELVDDGSGLSDALLDFRKGLPQPSTIERVHELASLPPWRWSEKPERRSELLRLVNELAQSGDIGTIIDQLSREEVSSAWHLGSVIGDVLGADVEPELIACASQNPPALAGFLDARVQSGDEAAFERLLSSDVSRALDPQTRLYLALSAPPTDPLRDLVLRLVEVLDVSIAAGQLLRWRGELSDDQVSAALTDWTSRIENDRDYAAIVDFLSMLSHRTGALSPALHAQVLELLTLRRSHRSLGHERWAWNRLAIQLVPEYARELVVLVFDLVGQNDMTLLDSDQEAAVVRAACEVAPEVVWDIVATRLEADDWRLSMSLRGWITDALPVDVLQTWVGPSTERARLLASVASAGSQEPSDAALFLLGNFGDDDDVAGSLAGELQSGSWIGPWSGRLREQIANLEDWRRSGDLPLGVRKWAGKMIDSLTRQREEALEREAERGY